MARPKSVDLAHLEGQSLLELRTTWAACFPEPVPTLPTRRLLALAIAHRLQTHRDGGLPGMAKRRLAELDRRFRANPTFTPTPMPALSPGCAIVKDWQGERHEVRVLEEGFTYRGVTFGSLSEVAQHITGTHWSGPRFFGLKPWLR